MKDNWKNLLIFIGIGVLLIGAILFVTLSGTGSKDTQYYEIVEMINNNEISSYTLNFSTGALKYTKRADGREYSYSVAAPDYFVIDIRDAVKENNSKYKPTDPQYIKYDYKAGSTGAWLISMIPNLLMIVIFAVLIFVLIRKMGDAAGGGTMSFGKVKAKKDTDKRKTTFADVAGADEEKEEMKELELLERQDKTQGVDD